jgi:hypothetical protein
MACARMASRSIGPGYSRGKHAGAQKEAERAGRGYGPRALGPVDGLAGVQMMRMHIDGTSPALRVLGHPLLKRGPGNPSASVAFEKLRWVEAAS